MQRGVQRGWRVLWFYLLWCRRCRCNILFRRARFEFSVGSFGFWIKRCGFWIIFFGFLITPQLVSESVSCGFWSDTALVSESHCKAWCWGSMFYSWWTIQKSANRIVNTTWDLTIPVLFFFQAKHGHRINQRNLIVPNSTKTFRAATFFSWESGFGTWKLRDNHQIWWLRTSFALWTANRRVYWVYPIFIQTTHRGIQPCCISPIWVSNQARRLWINFGPFFGWNHLFLVVNPAWYLTNQISEVS